MKLSEVTAKQVGDYIRVDSKESIVPIILSAAKMYVLNYTGLTAEKADDYEDLTVALLVLCSDMYDNRQMAVDNSSVNKVVQSILDMHCLILL